MNYNFRHYLLHPWIFFRDLKDEIKYFIQRGIRGYDETYWYDLYSHLTDIIIPNLRKQIKYHTCCPPEFFDEFHSPNECWKWAECLEEMCEGFEASRKLSELQYGINKEEEKLLLEKEEKGLGLFVKYYRNLWD